MPKRLKVTLAVILISFCLFIYSATSDSDSLGVFSLLICFISFCYAMIIIFKMVVFKGYYSEESIKKRQEKRRQFKKLKEENKQKRLEQKAKEKAERERIKREREAERQRIKREKEAERQRIESERKAQEQKKINEVWSDISGIPKFPEKTLNFLKKNYSLKEIQGMLGRGEKIQGIGPSMSDAILRVMRNKSF